MSNEKTAQRKKGTRKRIGFSGHRTRLQLYEEELKAMHDDGYQPYWHNDDKGGIEAAQAAGYIFVRPEEATSIGAGDVVKGTSRFGEAVSRIVTNSNPPVIAYLMKTKLEYYAEDQGDREKINAKVDETLKQGTAGGANIENQYGNVEITRG